MEWIIKKKNPDLPELGGINFGKHLAHSRNCGDG